MLNGKLLINEILDGFTGREGEPGNDKERYILKSMWLMMLSEFEAAVKGIAESYIDSIKILPIDNIHVCILIRNFHGNSEEQLTLNKIISFYKKNSSEISYRNFTKDKVPKYKTKAIETLFNNLGIFFTKEEKLSLDFLDGVASTRDSIAHGDYNVEITKKQLIDSLASFEEILLLLHNKIKI